MKKRVVLKASRLRPNLQPGSIQRLLSQRRVRTYMKMRRRRKMRNCPLISRSYHLLR
jgi:hypothetical protein